MVTDTIKIKMVVKLSLWSAIKLRIAGVKNNDDGEARDYFIVRNRYGKK